MADIDFSVLPFLQVLKKQIAEAELSAKLTGSKFNIFDILRLSTNEVRTHSAFLAELLDPKGVHGQGELYLNLFLDLFKGKNEFKNFGVCPYTVKIEAYIGPINDETKTGGRVDILIRDGKKQVLMIENKIYAGDQPEQLLRYHNFKPYAPLFYLTLSKNSKPSPESTGYCEKPYYILISYEVEILAWIRKCYEASAGLPVVRETLFQYIALVKKLTGLTEQDQIMKNAKAWITSKPEFIDSVVALRDGWECIKQEAKKGFEDSLRNSITKIVSVNSTCYIEISLESDDEGYSICMRLKENADSEQTLNTPDLVKRYQTTFRDAIDSLEDGVAAFDDNEYWNVGWFIPHPFEHYEHFESLAPNTILSIYNDIEAADKGKTLVGKIETQVTFILGKLMSLPQ